MPGQQGEELLVYTIEPFAGGHAYPANPGEAEVFDDVSFDRDKTLVHRPGFHRIASGVTNAADKGFFFSVYFGKYILACNDGLYFFDPVSGSTPAPTLIYAHDFSGQNMISFVESVDVAGNKKVYGTNTTIGLFSINSSGTVALLTAPSAPVEKCKKLLVRGDLVYALADGNTVFYTALANPESYPAANYFSTFVNLIDGFNLYDDLIFVMQNITFMRLSGLIEDEFVMRPWGYYEGVWFPNSATHVRNKVIYSTSTGMYLYDGTESKLLSSRFRTVSDTTVWGGSVKVPGNNSAGFFDGKYYVAYQTTDASGNITNRCTGYDTLNDNVIHITGKNIWGWEPGNSMRVMIDKSVFEIGSQDDDDGSPFTWHVKTGSLDQGESLSEKTYRKLWIYFDSPGPTAANPVTLTFWYESLTGSDSTPFTLNPASSADGTGTMYKLGLMQKISNVRRCKIDLTGSSPIKILGIAIGYERLRGLP